MSDPDFFLDSIDFAKCDRETLIDYPFHNITNWSKKNCIRLADYYHQYYSQKIWCWNDNDSLVNENNKDGEVVWSLIYAKSEVFDGGDVIVIPFEVTFDDKGVVKASTTISKIKKEGVLLSTRSGAISEKRGFFYFYGLELRIGGYLSESNRDKKSRIERHELVLLLSHSLYGSDRILRAERANKSQSLKSKDTNAVIDDRILNFKISYKLNLYKTKIGANGENFDSANLKKPESLDEYLDVFGNRYMYQRCTNRRGLIEEYGYFLIENIREGWYTEPKKFKFNPENCSCTFWIDSLDLHYELSFAQEPKDKWGNTVSCFSTNLVEGCFDVFVRGTRTWEIPRGLYDSVSDFIFHNDFEEKFSDWLKSNYGNYDFIDTVTQKSSEYGEDTSITYVTTNKFFDTPEWQIVYADFEKNYIFEEIDMFI